MNRPAIWLLFMMLSLSIPRDVRGQTGPGTRIGAGVWHRVSQERKAFAWSDSLKHPIPEGYGYSLKLRSDTLNSNGAGAGMCLQAAYSGGDFGGIEFDSCGFASDSLFTLLRIRDTVLFAPKSFMRLLIEFPGGRNPVFFSYALEGDTLVLSTYWVHLQNSVITFLPGAYPLDTIALICRGWIAKDNQLRVLDSQNSLSGEIDRYEWKLLPGLPAVSIPARRARRYPARTPAVDARGRRMPPALILKPGLIRAR